MSRRKLFHKISIATFHNIRWATFHKIGYAPFRKLCVRLSGTLARLGPR